MRSLIKLIITQNAQKALNWLPEGMGESIDKGKSEFTVNDAQVLVEFKGSAYILTISPFPKAAGSAATQVASTFLLECIPTTVKMRASQDSYPPNIIALAGQPEGDLVGALQIGIPTETGTVTRTISITFQFTQTFRGKVYPSLLTVGTVDGKYTFSNTKNVYTITGEIAYDISDMTKLFGYYINVSDLGATQVCQSE